MTRSKIKSAIHRADLTQAQVARRAKVDQSCLCRWLRGAKTMSEANVRKVAGVVGVK